MGIKFLSGSIVTVFVMFLLISSATAVPCVDSQYVNDTIEKIEKTRSLFDGTANIFYNLIQVLLAVSKFQI